MIAPAAAVCRHAAKVGGTFSWEWPVRNLLWKEEAVAALFDEHPAAACVTSSAATGQKFTIGKRDQERNVVINKWWKVLTTHPRIPAALERFSVAPEGAEDEVVECRGRIARESAFYPPDLCRAIWSAVVPEVPGVVMCVTEAKGPFHRCAVAAYPTVVVLPCDSDHQAQFSRSQK